MAKPLVSDELWATHRTALASTQASSLPVPRRKPLDYRKVLTGIIFVLKTGIPCR